jgi:hypothetical protein
MASQSASRLVTITPLNLPLTLNKQKHKKTTLLGNSVNVLLSGDATYAPTGGGGGWQVIERPKRVAATQWFDRAPWSLTMECIVNESMITNNNNFYNSTKSKFDQSGLPYGPTSSLSTSNAQQNISVEHTCTELESWLNAIPNSLEPPVFSITGPVPGTRHLWALYSLEFSEALRDNAAGFRYQQNVKMVFYEYNSPAGNSKNYYMWGPAETYNYNASTGEISFRNYIVKENDTLKSIVKNHFPQTTVFRIQQLNNIRDPRNLTPGQRLIIPN